MPQCPDARVGLVLTCKMMGHAGPPIHLKRRIAASLPSTSRKSAQVPALKSAEGTASVCSFWAAVQSNGTASLLKSCRSRQGSTVRQFPRCTSKGLVGQAGTAESIPHTSSQQLASSSGVGRQSRGDVESRGPIAPRVLCAMGTGASSHAHRWLCNANPAELSEAAQGKLVFGACMRGGLAL